MLVDHEIEFAVQTSQILITPFARQMLQPASIDLRLGRELLLHTPPSGAHTDPAEDTTDHWHPLTMRKDSGVLLHPGELVLGATYEVVRLGERHAARFEGKSSLGRIGLMTHVTAGFIDPGFEGQITVELHNVSSVPIRLRPGMKIGQMCVFRLGAEPRALYGSKAAGSHYNGQIGPTPARSHENFHQTILP